MAKSYHNRKRPVWLAAKPEFSGFKKGYNPTTGEFERSRTTYEVDKTAMTMLKEERISGSQLSSGMKAHRKATDKLESLNFDPIERLIEQLEELDSLLTKERKALQPRATVITELSNAKTDILKAILPYKYGKAPILTSFETDYKEPIQIILTTGENNEPN